MSEEQAQRNKNEVFGGADMLQNNSMLSENERVKQELGFEIPIQEVPLPSKGKIYSTESTLYGKEAIPLRSMTATDEEILTSPVLAKKGQNISELLRACITDKSVNVDEMISGDRNALLVALRIISYGADYIAEVECPSCSHKQDFEFNMTKLPIKSLEIEPVSPGENKFILDLPMSKKKVGLKFFTGKDEGDLASTEEQKKKIGISDNSVLTSRLRYSILSIDGDTSRSKIELFIRNIPAGDARKIRNFLNKNEPGVELKSNFECRSCGESEEISVPINASFFWPQD